MVSVADVAAAVDPAAVEGWVAVDSSTFELCWSSELEATALERAQKQNEMRTSFKFMNL